MIDPNYKAEADGIIESKIEQLRGLTYAQARALTEVASEEIVIAGIKASVTVFRQDSPYQLEGRTLAVVLVARERWFGMVAMHIEGGLVFSPGEATREATELELQNSGG